MTKAQVIVQITVKTGADKETTEEIVEGFFKTVKSALENGEDVFIRGFGSFIVKKRAAKTGRNIARNTAVMIPEHFIPVFKPAEEFKNKVKAAIR